VQDAVTHAAWSAFASALAERLVVVRETDDAAHLLLKPHLRGATLADDIAVAPDGTRAMRRLVVMRQLFGIAAPAHTAARSPLWRRVFRTLELRRIDAEIAQAFAGARSDLERLRAETLASRASCGKSFDALEALLQWALGAAPSHPLVEVARHSAHDSAATASRVCDLLCPRWRLRHGIGTSDIASLPTGSDTAMPQGTEGDDASAGLQRPTHARAVSNANGAGALADDHIDGATWTAPATNRIVPRVRTRALPRGTAPPAAPRGMPEGRAHAIDEWDWRAQRFLAGWCTLYERRLHGRDSRFIDGVRRRHAALAREVHKRLAALRPEALQRVHGAHDGDELELERVIEALVERRAGRPNDRALYLRRDRTQRDVCAVFLVDTSASTDYVLRDPNAAPRAPTVPDDDSYLYAPLPAAASVQEPPPRRVIDVAKDALALMCDALQTLGDRFAVYAFSGHGRAQVELHVVKHFDDAVSARTAAALAALRPQGATRAGAAIRHASARLARQPQRHKVLIVVSDGYPEDIDYGPEPRELRYAIEDTAHALREAAALGIDSFNLSIDPAGHDYLRRMCPPARYMVIGDVAALPGELTKVYQSMTRAAG
jgi:nitric oxide reductase NorD protein